MGRAYIDNREFTDSVVKYKASCEKAISEGKPEPRIPECIGRDILLIATNLASKPNFSGYSYKDIMIDDAVENCLRYIKKFDHNKSSNAFSYFTQCCWYSFITVIQNEKKQSYLKAKMFFDRANDLYDVQENDEDFSLESDFIPFFDVENFEQKEAAKKLEAKMKQKDKLKGIEFFMEMNDDNTTEQ